MQLDIDALFKAGFTVIDTSVIEPCDIPSIKEYTRNRSLGINAVPLEELRAQRDRIDYVLHKVSANIFLVIPEVSREILQRIYSLNRLMPHATPERKKLLAQCSQLTLELAIESRSHDPIALGGKKCETSYQIFRRMTEPIAEAIEQQKRIINPSENNRICFGNQFKTDPKIVAAAYALASSTGENVLLYSNDLDVFQVHSITQKRLRTGDNSPNPRITSLPSVCFYTDNDTNTNNFRRSLEFISNN